MSALHLYIQNLGVYSIFATIHQCGNIINKIGKLQHSFNNY